MKEELGLRDDLDGHVYWIAGATQADRPLHSHDELELNLVVGGRAEYLIDGARVRLERGSLLWLFPSQEHSLSTSSSDFEMWVYVFRPRMVQECCRTPEYAPLTQEEQREGVSVQLYPQAFSELLKLCESTYDAFRENADHFNASVRYLLVRAWRQKLEHGSLALESRALHPGVFRAAMELVRDPAIASLADLSRGVGMSSEHLSRLFKQQMGQSLSDYRSDQRLRRFQEIFGDGRRMNLLEATVAAGFGSYTQFYRVHVKRTGRAPSSLKKSS